MVETDETGTKLFKALTTLKNIAKDLASPKKGLSVDIRNAATRLKEQAEWFQDAMKDYHLWDTKGMEDCMRYMEANLGIINISDDPLVLKCRDAHTRYILL